MAKPVLLNYEMKNINTIEHKHVIVYYYFNIIHGVSL